MIRAVKGMKDVLPAEMGLWRRVEQAARGVFESYLYHEIRTPVLEPTELFARSIGESTDIVEKEMYTFEDSHQRLSMRPENTAGVVRALIENRLCDAHGTERLYYIGPMFRRERPQKGRFRQFHQIGVEAFGDVGPYVDAEIIEMMVRFFERLGITAFEVRVNSLGCRECRPAYVEKLRAALVDLAPQLCEDCQRRREQNPLRVFDCKICPDKISTLPLIVDHLCGACREHFDGFLSHLARMKVSSIVWPRLVRGLDYYTRTTFEFTSVSETLGSQNALLGGGRYDGLVQLLGGPELCGIGFAAGIERLILALPESAPQRADVRFIAHLGEAAFERTLALARRLRAAGTAIAVGSPSKNLKAQFKEADRFGATTVYVIGPDEIEQGVVKVKDMQTGEQRLVPEGEIAGGPLS